MASFVGTIGEFKRYVGPMLRNLVKQITKSYKSEVGRCMHCGHTKNLESAHLHDRDRNSIIQVILENHTTEGVVTVDLKLFEGKFIAEHEPIEKSIIILCRPCHEKYDSKKEKTPKVVTENDILSTQPENRPFTNTEIQQRIVETAKNMALEELAELCNANKSKEIFNLDFPLFIRVDKNSSVNTKKKAVKDELGRNRWTWKYEFIRGDHIYAICTQWFPRHDKYVEQWLGDN